jgi:hypothetical protein
MKNKLQEFHNIGELDPLLPPLDNSSPLGGYAIPAAISLQNNQDKKTRDLGKLAEKILEDPLLQIMLSERVYSLMKEDLNYYKERSHSYGGRI